MKRAQSFLFWSVLFLALCGACGGPKIQSENLRLTQSLLTAVAAENGEWLAENERLIAARRSEGKLTPEEDRAFTAIVSQARRGEWDAAEEALRKIQKSQRAEPAT